MILVTGTVLVESEDQLNQMIDALIRRAQRSRNDKGCIDYTFSRSLENPLEIRILESWESEALLQAHLQIPDPEFSQLLSEARLTSAIVTSHQVSSTQTLMER